MAAKRSAVAALTPTFLKTGFFSMGAASTVIKPLPKH